MLQTVGLIILIAEILAFSFFIYAHYFNKKISHTKTIFVSVVFLINFSLYLSLFIEQKITTGEGNIPLGVIKAIFSSIGSFALGPDIKTVEGLIGEYPLFLATYMAGVALALFATVTVIIDAFKNRITNSSRYSQYSKGNEVTFVFGADDIAKNYVASHKNTVLLLPSYTSKEVKDSLIEEGYCVLTKLDNEYNAIFKLAKNPNKKYIFVMFDDNDKDDFTKIVDAFKAHDKVNNVYLYLEVQYEKIEYFKTILLLDDRCKIHITMFNRYESMTNDLCYNEPISKYLPKDFINEDTSIKKEKVINVFVIGFGWMNQEIYKKLLINNQYVEQDKDGYKAHLINYRIYDLNGRYANSFLISGINNLNEKLSKNKDRYFDLPEKLSNTEFFLKDVDSAGFLDEIEEICHNPDSMNYFFISYSDNFHNVALTAKIFDVIKDTQFHIYTRTTDASICDPHLFNVSYFGNTMNYLVHDKVVNYELYDIALRVNDAYAGQPTKKEDLMVKDFIKVYTNYFQAMNIRQKYHLLGLEYIKKESLKDEVTVNEEEFNKLVGKGTIKTYEDYFKHMTLAAETAAEHLHWNAEYIVYGYIPLPKDEHRVVNGKLIEQDIPNKKHGCITSYKGLDLRAKYLLRIHQDELGHKEKVLFSEDGKNAVEVYRYDYQFLLMSYGFLIENGYVVIKK